MFKPNYFLWVTATFILLAIFTSHLYFKLAWAWFALSFFSVSLAYLLNKPTIFRKRSDGTMPFYIRWVFMPFLWSTQLYNSWARSNDPVPALQKIDDGVYLARRLFPSDIHDIKNEKIRAVLDVTAEFSSLNWMSLQANIDYLNIPILDHSVPTDTQIQRALNWIHTHKKNGRSVVVHCALGRGRSVFMVAAYLLSQYPDAKPKEIMNKIRDIRPTVRLNNKQFEQLNQAFENKRLVVHNSAWIIANPVAGKRQWEEEHDTILKLLSGYYNLTVKTTTLEVNGTELAKQALKNSPDLVIACGGDGTVTEVATALVGTKVKLGIIPFGTTNALSHALCGSLSKIPSTKTICLNIIDGCEQRIDTATCNDELMLLLAGVGFEQQMIEKADREKNNNSGQIAYLQDLWEAISQNDVHTFKVTLNDSDTFEIDTPSLTIANASPVTALLAQGKGGPDIKDGELDLTWLDPERMQILNLAELAMLGLGDNRQKQGKSQQSSSGVFHKTALKVAVDIRQIGHYVVDGEAREADTLEVVVRPKSLSVVVPESALKADSE
ncbi:diacylglycerol kinase family protein [Marinomonas posidonica]|uniref:Diacylglycerol kinase catalytic region n=1 Tax=Marinomonas posidonica (strain CECT 7376 / NCIMB 14433 / IVIA-Po-181) TaxID=491952 RepID=F6CWG3_MARPP|nr:diacylglycerol kinase family protein [Marinomonas posidonica]AEF53218.1 diacylglycerol kinase catalytic region [Marinomonas posidonica IVIA-Po-181]